MSFARSEEEILLQNSLARFLANEYSFARRRDLINENHGHDPATWRKMAELGLMGAALPEEYGGFDGGPRASATIMQELGRALVLEPYLSTAILCGGLLARHGSTNQRAEILPALIAGDCRLALAHWEAEARYDIGRTALAASSIDGGHELNGEKHLVLDGVQADHLIVSVRTSGVVAGAAGALQGLSLFLLPINSPGITRRDFRGYDGMRVSILTFENVRVDRGQMIGVQDQGAEIIAEALDDATVALCAEAVGAMQALFDMLMDYLRTRKQFGRALGNFQALQHRAADQFMILENARAMTNQAIDVLQQGASPPERARAVSAAKLQINDAAALVGREGLQMHGAIAITDEYAGSHYFKRIEAIESLFGDRDYHLSRFIQDY